MISCHDNVFHSSHTCYTLGHSVAGSGELKDRENIEDLELHGESSAEGEVVLWGTLQVQGDV